MSGISHGFKPLISRLLGMDNPLIINRLLMNGKSKLLPCVRKIEVDVWFLMQNCSSLSTISQKLLQQHFFITIEISDLDRTDVQNPTVKQTILRTHA